MKPENTEDGLKFYGISLENFKNISHKVIDIGGGSFGVLGRNGAGKSTLIQALCSPLDTKVVPMEPIKKGEERSKIEVLLKGYKNGLPVKYTLELYFSPGNKKGRLVVLNENEEVVKSPATFVKGLIGNISFDITAWLHESKEKKLKMLKQLTGCEIDIDKINVLIKDKKADKKGKKERAEELEAVLKNHGYTQDQIELYSKPKPTEPIQEELANISKSIDAYNGIESQMKGFREAIVKGEENIKGLRDKIEKDEIAYNEEIKRLELLIQKEKSRHNNLVSVTEELISSCFTEINKLKGNLVKGDAWLKEKVKPSSAEITQRLNDAIAHNEHYNIVSGLAAKQKEMLKFKGELTAIDTEVEKLEKQRGDLIAKSQLPIKGLTFSDDEIFIDGLPLDESQQNTAHLFDIGVDVAIALNPGLKVIFLNDASLYDEKNLAAIIKKIEDKNFQVVYELVSDGELDIKFSEREAE